MGTPSVGRVVHYNNGSVESPVWLCALICAVHSPSCINVTVFDENGEHLAGRTSVSLGDGQGEWRWPPRV